MKKSKKAFSMIELVFVIVIIGILAGIAIPKLAATRNDATMVKAKTTVASIRNALATQRQKLILSGQFNCTNPTLGSGDNVFDTFSYTDNGCPKNDLVLNYPIRKCESGKKGCWTVSSGIYSYSLPSSGTINFKIESNRFICKSSATLCKKLE